MTDTNHHVLTGKVDITSNLLVGSSHLFVDTNNNRVGLVTTNPDAGLHVNSNAYVNTDLRVGSQIEINATAGRVKAGSFEGDGSLLENIPAGADGAAATIGDPTITTGLAGTDASVTNSGTSSAAVFDFVIPRGDAGTNGEDGAAATIGNPTITTGLAGTEASVTNSGTSSAAVFDFVIPRGDPGTNGTNYFELSGSDIYRSSGNVGIGVTSPDGPLHLNLPANSNYTGFTYQSGDVKTVLGNTGNGGTNTSFVQVYSGVSSSVPDANSSTYNLALQPHGGNVGIGGVLQPAEKLDVNGNIKASGYVSTPYLYRSSHNSGYMVGSYNSVGANSTMVNPIYTIGSNYMPTGDNAIGSMYGIGYSHGNFTSLLTGGWGMYVASGGHVRIGLNAQHGHIKNTGDIYCSNRIYSSNGIHCQGDWFRVNGTRGIHWESYGNGWFAQDSTYMRSYNNRWVYTGGGFHANAFRVSGGNNNLEMRLYVDNIAFFGDAGINGYIEDDHAYGGAINFTGQHRTFIKDIPHQKAIDYEGYIVCADQNRYVKMSYGVETGNKAITINESLPIVSLSNKVNDKSCFGVISSTEDPDERMEKHGKFVSLFKKETGDTRVYINSVGEGAVWVTNINGSLESGDYITTSDILGYGQKQISDSLKNYTVAKITMDCDFNPTTQKVKKIKKSFQDVTYWVKKESIAAISDEQYNRQPEENREIIESKYYNTEHGVEITEDVYNDLLEEEKEKYSEQIRYTKHIIKITKERVKPKQDLELYVEEIYHELDNDLDENGEFQWEDTDETEKAYQIRYLLPDGTQISEEEYTTRALADEKVYVAAFIGCTYHCG